MKKRTILASLVIGLCLMVRNRRQSERSGRVYTPYQFGRVLR